MLKTAAAELAEAGVESSDLEAELLLRETLGISRAALFLKFDQQLPSPALSRFQKSVLRRCTREPLQYIVGRCEFWSLDFKTTPDVLIPRPETEFLLEHTIARLESDEKKSPLHFLDLCTGSGVIAVVLAHEFPDAVIHAIDCSAKALAVASENALSHNVTGRVEFVCCDLFSGLNQQIQWDVIVSNPPYVKSGDIPDLAPEVSSWEPELALSGGITGVDVIQRICAQATRHLRIGGWLFMEIGADISQHVLEIFLTSGNYEQVAVVQDWAGKPRVLQAKFVG